MGPFMTLILYDAIYDANCTTGWLDHVLTSTNNIVTNVSILYRHTIEDHIPVKFEIIPPQEETYFGNAISKLETNNTEHYVWNMTSESDIIEY